MSNDSYKSESICAISSPPGVGGVSLIRISGAESFSIAEKIFSKSLKDTSGYKVLFGKIIEKKLPKDLVLRDFFLIFISYFLYHAYITIKYTNLI